MSNTIDFTTRGKAGLRLEIAAKLDVMRQVYLALAPPGAKFELTGTQEWEGHEFESLHHLGFAVDIRTKYLPGGGYGPLAAKIATQLQVRLSQFSPSYKVILHRPPYPPHIHVEFRAGSGPGGRSGPSPQGDWDFKA